MRRFSGHVSEPMEKKLADDDEERFSTLFKSYIADGIDADSLEDIYADAHEAIKENPTFVPTERSSPRNNTLLNLRSTDKPKSSTLKERPELLPRLLLYPPLLKFMLYNIR